jgi:PhoPQ-activated pathogenicity-related protein
MENEKMKRLILSAIFFAWLLVPLSAEKDLPLRQFVVAEDDSYSWSAVNESRRGDVITSELRMTSQTWQGVAWKHRMFVVRPETLKYPKQALLLLSGGSWKSQYDREGGSKPSSEVMLVGLLAKHLGMPVAILHQVPFQPIDGKKEDALIADTFKRYLDGGADDLPLLMPMTKAAVRGMDTVQAFIRQEAEVEVEHFVVSGASKRGWTTWLTGAIDDRVNAIGPMVIDVLNMKPQMKHQLDSWGAYSPQIEDYSRNGIQEKLDTERGKELLGIVDPYSYRGQLQKPKFIFLGTNDPYWPVDALDLYWDELQGKKYIYYGPNLGHSLGNYHRVLGGLLAVTLQAAGAYTIPEIDWTVEVGDEAVTVTLQTDATPKAIKGWSATSKTRDFRESTWKSTDLEGRRFVFDLPRRGHGAAFIECTFLVNGEPYTLCTQIGVGKRRPKY